MVSTGGISFPGCVPPPPLRHKSFSPPSAFGFARFSNGISFKSMVVVCDGAEKKGSRAVIVNGKVDGLGKSECEIDLDATLGNGHAGNSGIASILMSVVGIILIQGLDFG